MASTLDYAPLPANMIAMLDERLTTVKLGTLGMVRQQGTGTELKAKNLRTILCIATSLSQSRLGASGTS